MCCCIACKRLDTTQATTQQDILDACMALDYFRILCYLTKEDQQKIRTMEYEELLVRDYYNDIRRVDSAGVQLGQAYRLP